MDMNIFRMFIMLITVLCVSAATSSSEAGPNSVIDYELTEEYAQHPDRFFSGSGIGTGAIRRYKKSTLNVEQYNPPHYIISIEVVGLYYVVSSNSYVAHAASRERFYYNWETKKAYREYKNPNNNFIGEWREIKRNFRNEKGIANDIFRLAYNMDFFSIEDLKF